MAKVSSREDALLSAYLNRYKNAQASTVNEGQNKTQTARAKGAALLNATDKTLPVLKDTYSDTLQNIRWEISASAETTTEPQVWIEDNLT